MARGSPTLPGPRGRVDGAIVIQEKLMDGLLEDKTFAPGYGEFHFRVAAEKELVDLALAVPTDAEPGPVPSELSSISAGADDIFRTASSKDWTAVSRTVDTMTAAWDALQADDVPQLFSAQMSSALDVLGDSVRARNAASVEQAAIAVAHASLDLQLQHRGVPDVDRDRLELWARQVLVDAAADDAALVAGDVVILETIRDRVAHTLDVATRNRIEPSIAELRNGVDAGDLSSASEIAEELRTALS